MDQDHRRFIIVKARAAFTREQLREILVTGRPKKADLVFSTYKEIIVFPHSFANIGFDGYEIVIYKHNGPSFVVHATRNEMEN